MAEDGPGNFVDEIVADDVLQGRRGGRVSTRFPPEPNGYLHIGHAKSISLNFGVALRHGGTCNLRYDDTNPVVEDARYVDSIERDVRWLGFSWDDRKFYASDYFEKLYEFAQRLVNAGKAYVDSQTGDEIRKNRGNYHEPGVDSPFRTRTVAENLDLLRRMRAGEFPDGAHVLRAKIDMQSKNLNMRDPLLYRIKHAKHHRTGDAWCIYPMYDYAHPLSDAIEGITHSICTLEFQDHRPLYDWCVAEVGAFPDPPRQIEFARLNLTYTMLSKRRLLELVTGGIVAGWDDPRMPTLAALRRRGYTPEAIREFCDRVGVARKDGVVDVSLLEHAVREDLNRRCLRAMGVLRPLRVVLENYPEGEVDWLDAPWHPEDAGAGARKVPFSRVLWVDRDDFKEDAPKKWFRLAPGREVRLRYAALVTCKEVVKDDRGEVVELRCEWDPQSRGGNAPDGRRVQGTLHWVSAAHALDAEVRLYDRLFTAENVPSGDEWKASLNPASLETLRGCKVEPALATAEPASRWQFERVGYFCCDAVDSKPGALVFNRTIGLRDTWAKIEKASA